MRPISSPRPPSVRTWRCRPRLEHLEDRLAPATITVNTTDQALFNSTTVTVSTLGRTVSLRDAVNAANNTLGPDTIVLQKGATYTFAPTGADNFWYGPNALPAISSDITIEGKGAVLQRAGTGTATANALRFFYVSGGLSGLPAGSLTLRDLTLRDGLAKGGDSQGGGGGMGAGGAIFSQGAVTLDRVTLTGNTALGGSDRISAISVYARAAVASGRTASPRTAAASAARPPEP
jgi:hypothetical protein